MARIVDSKQIHHYQDLVDSIAESWDKESVVGSELDIILEQVDKPFGRTGFRLYVVTPRFSSIPMPLRSQIIINAFIKNQKEWWPYDKAQWGSEQEQEALAGFESAIGASSPEEAARLGIPGYEEFE